MSSTFYALRASHELASSQFGGIPAAPSLFAGCTKQPMIVPGPLASLCGQRPGQCLLWELRTSAVTPANSGKVPGLLTSGSLFHHRSVCRGFRQHAQNAVTGKRPGGAAIMARMPAPRFTISIYSSPLFTSHHSSRPSIRRIPFLRFDLICLRSFRSFRLSLGALSPCPIRSTSSRPSSVPSSSVSSSPSLGVSVHAS